MRYHHVVLFMIGQLKAFASRANSSGVICLTSFYFGQDFEQPFVSDSSLLKMEAACSLECARTTNALIFEERQLFRQFEAFEGTRGN